MVLEVESQHLCQTGFDEEPEVHYKADQEAVLAPCRSIKHVFARTARDSPDVLFLALDVRLWLRQMSAGDDWHATQLPDCGL